MTCGGARPLALRREEGSLGRLAAWRLARHLAACPDCRDFAAAAPSLARRAAAALLEEPGPAVEAALRARAVAGLERRGDRERARDAARWGGGIAAATAAAAACGLLLALVHPTAFAPRPKHPAPLDERIAAARAELDRLDDPEPAVPAGMNLDERLRSLDRQLHCLEDQITPDRWEGPQGGTPCTES